MLSALMVLGILIVGLRLTFQILPPWVGSLVAGAAKLLLRLVFGTGNKGRG